MTSPNEKRSKRQALRFAVEGFEVRYKTEFADGKGALENISSGGCAMKDLSLSLTLQEKILVILELDDAETIEIGARVRRLDEGHVAIEFTDLAESKRSKIVKYFARKQRVAGKRS